MRRRSIPLLLLLIVSACAQLNDGGRRGDPRAEGNRPATVGTAIADQWQTPLRETAAELKLTPRQLVLWERYQDEVGTLMADQLSGEPAAPRRLSAPQQIDARLATIRHRLSTVEALAASASALYATLDAEQKTIADRTLAATVPPLYSGLISCVTIDNAHDKPGGNGPPARR